MHKSKLAFLHNRYISLCALVLTAILSSQRSVMYNPSIVVILLKLIV